MAMQPRFVTSHRHPHPGRRSRRVRRRIAHRRTDSKTRLATSRAACAVFMVPATAQPNGAWLN